MCLLTQKINMPSLAYMEILPSSWIIDLKVKFIREILTQS